MRKKLFFFIVFCLMPASAGFGQPKAIDREEFYKPYRAAVKSSRENSSRKTVKSEHFEDGILLSTQNDVYEIAAPDRNHRIEIEKTGDRIIKFEAITIGSVKYCRKNDGEWQVGSDWCSARGSGSGGLSNFRNDTYSVEESKIEGREVKIYRNRYVYEGDEPGASYWERIFWLDEKGRFLREEIRTGLLEPELLSRLTVTTFEYNLTGLKIEAPPIAPARKPE